MAVVHGRSKSWRNRLLRTNSSPHMAWEGLHSAFPPGWPQSDLWPPSAASAISMGAPTPTPGRAVAMPWIYVQNLWEGQFLSDSAFEQGEGNGTPLQDPGGLQSIGSLGVGHDRATSFSLFTFIHWRRKWQPTPVFLPGESQGQGSLVGCRLWGHTESDTTEAI